MGARLSVFTANPNGTTPSLLLDKEIRKQERFTLQKVLFQTQFVSSKERQDVDIVFMFMYVQIQLQGVCSGTGVGEMTRENKQTKNPTETQ